MAEKILIPTDEFVKRYQEGWSVRQVATHFDVAYGSVHRRLKAAGVLRQHGGPRIGAGRPSNHSQTQSGV